MELCVTTDLVVCHWYTKSFNSMQHQKYYKRILQQTIFKICFSLTVNNLRDPLVPNETSDLCPLTNLISYELKSLSFSKTSLRVIPSGQESLLKEK